ncbi:MAG: hypothetical protein J0L55_08800 [Caulobacterales bacterium]|nr:hypothetical protein [Caulobacterales bacterium]MCA0372669.1 hypothetical protein [Pseudomonadota bacterium]
MQRFEKIISFGVFAIGLSTFGTCDAYAFENSTTPELITQIQKTIGNDDELLPFINLNLSNLTLPDNANLVDIIDAIRNKIGIKDAKISLLIDDEIYESDNAEDIELLKQADANDYAFAQIFEGEDGANTLQSNRIVKLIDAVEKDNKEKLSADFDNQISFDDVKNAPKINQTQKPIYSANQLKSNFSRNVEKQFSNAQSREKHDINGNILDAQKSTSEYSQDNFNAKGEFRAQKENLNLAFVASFENSDSFYTDSRKQIKPQSGKSQLVENLNYNQNLRAALLAQIDTAFLNNALNIKLENQIQHESANGYNFLRQTHGNFQTQAQSINQGASYGLSANLKNPLYNFGISLKQDELALSSLYFSENYENQKSEIAISQGSLNTYFKTNIKLSKKLSLNPSIEAKLYDFVQNGPYSKSESGFITSPKVELAYSLDEKSRIWIEAAKRTNDFEVDGIRFASQIIETQDKNKWLKTPSNFSTKVRIDHNLSHDANLSLQIENQNINNKIASLPIIENGNFVGTRVSNVDYANQKTFQAKLKWQLDKISKGLIIDSQYQISKSQIPQLANYKNSQPLQSVYLNIKKDAKNGMAWGTYMRANASYEINDFKDTYKYPQRTELGLYFDVPYKNGIDISTSINGVINSNNYTINNHYNNLVNFGNIESTTFDTTNNSPYLMIRLKKGL